jgi:TrkA domain protein
MADVDETPLPGMGIRYDFTTEDGDRLGVLVHRTGRRDIFLYSADDPDECRATITLRTDDARTLSELLGASRVAEHLAAVQQQVAGLTLDWIQVSSSSPWAGLTMREAGVHTETGASVVAIIDGDDVTAAPGAEDVLVPGAQIVAIGTADGVALLNSRLSGR